MKDSMDGRGRDVMTVVSGRAAHVLLLEAHVRVLMEALQVMSLLQVKALVQFVLLLKALLKLFSLPSPLTQTTMPQTRLAARTSR